jgi:hypothetical protein
MSGRVSLILFFVLLLAACEKDKPKLSGIETIDNNLYETTSYYALGFSFTTAQKVSTIAKPGPDITIDNDGTLDNLILQTNNYKDSFFKTGDYPDAVAAIEAFNALTAPQVPQWTVWAFDIKPDQVWVFRTGAEKYAKIRIISVVSETRSGRDYAECTFEWAYQPDGTLTFPPK